VNISDVENRKNVAELLRITVAYCSTYNIIYGEKKLFILNAFETTADSLAVTFLVIYSFANFTKCSVQK
jgi:hypothetical protein